MDSIEQHIEKDKEIDLPDISHKVDQGTNDKKFGNKGLNLGSASNKTSIN